MTSGGPERVEISDERLKANLLRLADHHRQVCDGECQVTLYLLRFLLERAAIEVTAEEARRLL